MHSPTDFFSLRNESSLFSSLSILTHRERIGNYSTATSPYSRFSFAGMLSLSPLKSANGTIQLLFSQQRFEWLRG